jgi:hypothetical protein
MKCMSQHVEAAVIAATGTGLAAVLWAVGQADIAEPVAVLGLAVFLVLGLVCLWPRLLPARPAPRQPTRRRGRAGAVMPNSVSADTQRPRSAARNRGKTRRRGAVLYRRREATPKREKRTVYELEVDEIGPSLRYATAKVQKIARSGGGGGGFGAPNGGGGNRQSSGGGGGGNFDDPGATSAPASSGGGRSGGGNSSFDDEPRF